MSSLKSLFSRGLLILILLSLGLGACQPAAAPTPALVIPTLPLSPTSPVSLTPTPAQSGAQTATRFINTLTLAVQSGAVPQTRIDDAVKRILTVKFKIGLFERPLPDTSLFGQVGSDAHRQLGREAVAKSLVLLKNDAQTLPLSKNTPLIVVAGQAAGDIGIQCGGWTLSWQGQAGAVTRGTSILKGLQAAASGSVLYNRFGDFKDLPSGALADVGVVVVGEQPYAEGQGVADVLFGDQPFTGKLPFTWPKSMDQLPFNLSSPAAGAKAPLFAFGYGLTK